MEPYFPDVIRVSDAELDDPNFIRDVREYLSYMGISSHKWGDVLLDAYCKLPNRILHEVTGKPVYLDTRDLEDSTQREWFRDLMEPIPNDHAPYNCAKPPERFRFVATILRALDPNGAAMWHKPANDNVPKAANDNKPGS